MGKKALLVVSFGTSFEESGKGKKYGIPGLLHFLVWSL